MKYHIGTTLGYSYGPAFDDALQAGRLSVEQNGKEDTSFRLLELGRIDLHPQTRCRLCHVESFVSGRWR